MNNLPRLIERVNDLNSATQRLQEACAQPKTSFMRDAVIQRFEFCWELAWKALKLRLDQLGLVANNPRDVFKEALAANELHNGNDWSEAQRMRNLTSHTYDEELCEEVYGFILNDGLAMFQQLALDAKSWIRN